MLIEYDENGRIHHMIHDPVSPEIVEIMVARGALNVPPTKLPPEPVLEDGQPVLGEDGQPVMTERSIFHKCDIMGDYILDGAITPRPIFPFDDVIEIVADEQHTVSLTVPDPCQIRIDGEPMTITGGQLELTSDMPAEYIVELVQWPYVEKTIKVIAHAAE